MSRRAAAAAALIAVVLGACSAGPGAGGQLDGTEWVLNSYAVAGQLTIVPETIYADAEFDSHLVTGQSGCNSYRALYQTGGRTLIVSQAAATLMACDQPSMDFEQTYLTLLQSSRFFTARGDTLTIYDGIGSPVLVFDAAPRNPLLGRWNVDAFLVPPSTVTSPLKGTQLDVAFGIASIGGSSGCNTFSGTYGTNGNTVRVGPLATTRLACDQDVMDQETAFLAALQGVAFIDYRGDQVLLTDRNGSIDVALSRPVPPEEASPSPSAAATSKPTASPTAAPSKSAAPTATPTPTPSPTAAPTPTPTTAPTATPPASPSSAPSPPIPSTASCDLAAPGGGPVVASLVYPGTWNTLTEPPELACRYFDPQSITVPADPATLRTTVVATVSTTAYADAVTAATDPATWAVVRKVEAIVGTTKATCVAATAVKDGTGITAGSPSFACVVDLGTTGTVVLQTIGTATDQAFATNAGVVALMTQLSTFTPTA